jgi:hypothetical protein
MSLKLQQIINGLESSKQFQDFKKQNPDAELCAGFFTLNISENSEEYNLDYKSGESIFSFNVPLDTSLITMKQDQVYDKSKPLIKLNSKIKIQLSDIKDIVEKQFKKHEILAKIDRIIAVLHTNPEGKTNRTIWNLTCLLKGFDVITIHIDAMSGRTNKFEKRNLFEFIKK